MTVKHNLTTRQYFSGFLLALLAALGFSTKAIFVKLSYRYGIDATTLLTLRMLFSAPVFFVVALRHVLRREQPKLRARDYGYLFLLGLTGYYLSSLLDFMGLQYISAAMERLILFLYPTLVLLLSVFVLGKPCGRKEVMAVILCYIGILIVFATELQPQTERFWLGVALVFASTLTYATYLIGAGPVIARLGASRFTAYAMLVACVLVVAQFVSLHPLQDLSVPLPVYQYSVLMAIIATIAPVFMLSMAIRRIGSAHTSLIGMIGPVSTLFLAHWILAESLTLMQIAGAVVVMVGVMQLSRR